MIGPVHIAQQIDPADCPDIQAGTRNLGPGITASYRLARGEPAKVQAIQFDAGQYTVEEARAWLKAYGFSDADLIAAETAATTPAAGQCPAGDKCPMHAMDYSARGPAEIRCGGSGPLEISALAGSGKGPPTVSMTAYTGVPMRLDGFHLPMVVDLESLRVPRQSIPILRSHDAERIAGHTTSIDLTPRRLKVEGVLSGQANHTEDVVANAGRGFPWQVSIGASRPPRLEHVKEGETVKVNGRNWNGPLLVARGATLREVSVLPLGADGDTSASVAAAFGDILAFTHNSEVSKNEPDWASVDKTALPMLAFADHGAGADDQSNWGYPHHWVENAGAKDDQGNWTTGTLLLHAGGLDAAWSAAQGGRSGQKASQAVIDHLQAHRRALGLDNAGG